MMESEQSQPSLEDYGTDNPGATYQQDELQRARASADEDDDINLAPLEVAHRSTDEDPQMAKTPDKSKKSKLKNIFGKKGKKKDVTEDEEENEPNEPKSKKIKVKHPKEPKEEHGSSAKAMATEKLQKVKKLFRKKEASESTRDLTETPPESESSLPVGPQQPPPPPPVASAREEPPPLRDYGGESTQQPGDSSTLNSIMRRMMLVRSKPVMYAQEGPEPVLELKPLPPRKHVRCSTFIVAVLLSVFVLGILLCALSGESEVASVLGPICIALSLMALIGKVFLTLFYTDEPHPLLKPISDAHDKFMKEGPNMQSETRTEPYPRTYTVTMPQPAGYMGPADPASPTSLTYMQESENEAIPMDTLRNKDYGQSTYDAARGFRQSELFQSTSGYDRARDPAYHVDDEVIDTTPRSSHFV